MNAIEARGLQKRFGATVAVEDFTLEVPRGSATALLGPNGAGKTTTVRMLTALLRPSGGEARVNGRTVGQEDDAIRREVGLLTEVPGLYARLSARDNLRFFAGLYDLPRPATEARIEHWLRRFGLWEVRDRQAGGFSTGMRQKLALVRALLHEPKVLFLDEPTSGLDPESTRTVREVIRDHLSGGGTVMLCTHQLDEAERLCDRVAVLNRRVLTTQPLGAPDGRVRVTLAAGAARLAEVAAAVEGVAACAVEGNELVLEVAGEAVQPRLVRALVEAGGEIVWVAPERGRLEALYFSLVGGAA
jgi:ABC-2 type transport system ATP-binding protein